MAKSAKLAGQRMLDFGCGDGSYLALLLESPHAPREGVGAELDASVVTMNRERFAAESALGEPSVLRSSQKLSGFGPVAATAQILPRAVKRSARSWTKCGLPPLSENRDIAVNTLNSWKLQSREPRMDADGHG